MPRTLNNKVGDKRFAMNSVDYLIGLNTRQSALFDDPGMSLEREKYRAVHPTEIAFIKCMDGRVHGPVMTNTPLGVIQPWRNIGGKFDLGWIGFAQSIKEWVEYSKGRGRNCLVVVTYHYARGSKHRGCRGFGYDVDVAKKFTRELKEQFDRVFGQKVVYTVQCGIETDWESFIPHGENGKSLDLAEVRDSSINNLTKILKESYPNMPSQTLNDFLPLVQGNIEHVREVRKMNRPIIEAEHMEDVLGVGRGFDWLHEINKALIVGPFDPSLAMTIATAAKLIKGNIDKGRVQVSKNRGIVLLASAPYRKRGYEQRLAEEKARFLNKFSLNVIKKEVPELMPHLQQLTVTVDMTTRKFDILSSVK